MSFIEKLIGGDNEEEKDEEIDEGGDDAQDDSSDEEEGVSEKKEKSKPASDIDRLKITVIDAILKKLDKKNLVKGLLRGKGIKSAAKEYILESKQEQEDLDLGGLNLPPEALQFASALKGSGSAFLPSMLKKFTGISIGYDEEKELNPMKEFMSTATQDQLNKLKDSIPKWDGRDVKALLAVVGTGVAGTTVVANESGGEKFSGKRKRVVESIGTILKRDKDKPIPYVRGGTDVEKQGGVDCAGFVYYAIKQAGLEGKYGTSRQLFDKFPTKKLELDDKGHVTTDVSGIQEGDVIFRNSLNPEYRRSTGDIPVTEKDGQKYRIHHIAFIKSIDRDKGTVAVVESNGSEGVTESTINVSDALHKASHKSELYVAHVDYDQFNDAPDQKTQNESQKLVASN